MEYRCNTCNKTYKSYKSLWNHNKNFHKNMSPKIEDNVNHLFHDKYKCIKCNKEYKYRQGLWKHAKNCNKLEDNKIDLVIKENIEIKKEMEKLKIMLQKAMKIHPKTLTKINKQLNNYGTINNINIIQLGHENLSDILTEKEKIKVVDRQAMSVNTLVELAHISGKYKQFMNIYITNLQNNIAYKYDEKANNFIAVDKYELLKDLVDYRTYDIEKFFNEYQDKFNTNKIKQITKFLDRMYNKTDNYKDNKLKEIKYILYNNSDKMLNIINSNENNNILT